MTPNLSADAALKRLRQGNNRFATNVVSIDSLARTLRRDSLASGQRPFATVLGCSDSRAPAELVFDQGLGDLFVIRVAGNVVSPSQVGSVEFAAERYGTRLVVVMGHTKCGAVEPDLPELIAEALEPSAVLVDERHGDLLRGRGAHPTGGAAGDQPFPFAFPSAGGRASGSSKKSTLPVSTSYSAPTTASPSSAMSFSSTADPWRR